MRQVDNGTGSYCGSNPCTVSLSNASPPTFNFANNTIHTITVLNNTFSELSTDGQYVWSGWANYYGTSSPTTWTNSQMLVIGPLLNNYTGTAGFTAVFNKQYPETVNVVDSNNNPVQGANVTITYVNGTSKTYVSDSKGQVNLGDIPNGSFGATVTCQNQVYGPYRFTVVNNPTNTITVNANTPATTTTTAIVLLAIFGLAFFLIILAIRVRRPPPPPRISSE